jgi:hypothetical protein
VSTVRRDFRASPHRTGCEVWEAIACLLAPKGDSAARKELLSVNGIAAQLISTESCKDYPIIASGSGDRVRIYCVFDEDAMDEDNGKEDKLAFDATAKDWKVSIPVEEEDIDWSTEELKRITKRITVRGKTEEFDTDEQAQKSSSALALNLGEFLKK